MLLCHESLLYCSFTKADVVDTYTQQSSERSSSFRSSLRGVEKGPNMQKEIMLRFYNEKRKGWKREENELRGRSFGVKKGEGNADLCRKI